MKKILSVMLAVLFCGCSFVGCGLSKKEVEIIQFYLIKGVWKRYIDWEDDGVLEGVWIYTFYDNGMFTFNSDWVKGTIESIAYGKYEILQDQIKLSEQINFYAGGSSNTTAEKGETILSYSYQAGSNDLTLSDEGGTYKHIVENI